MKKTNIYNVNGLLVRAVNRPQAVSYVARKTFQVSLASQDDLFQAGRDGLEIEDATSIGADEEESE